MSTLFISGNLNKGGLGHGRDSVFCYLYRFESPWFITLYRFRGCNDLSCSTNVKQLNTLLQRGNFISLRFSTRLRFTEISVNTT